MSRGAYDAYVFGQPCNPLENNRILACSLLTTRQPCASAYGRLRLLIAYVWNSTICVSYGACYLHRVFVLVNFAVPSTKTTTRNIRHLVEFSSCRDRQSYVVALTQQSMWPNGFSNGWPGTSGADRWLGDHIYVHTWIQISTYASVPFVDIPFSIL
jgi:hypothetical protein